MFSHRQAISAAYVVAGLYFGFVAFRDIDSILAAQRAFFDLSPLWYANMSALAIAAAPLALLAVAVMVYLRMKWWLVAIPAAYGTLITLGLTTIMLAAYLVWYYAFGRRKQKSSVT